MDVKNNSQLSEDTIKKVAGGTKGAVEKLENDRACGSFICTMCGRDYDHHKIETDETCTQWVLTNNDYEWEKEWRDHQLDCNHCKYFRHINWSFGECLKDCQ